VIAVDAQKVRVRLPKVRAKHVTLLVARTSPAFHQAGEWLEVVVPSIAEHEVVAIDV
jgi:hypothetical protein